MYTLVYQNNKKYKGVNVNMLIFNMLILGRLTFWLLARQDVWAITADQV